MKKKLMACLFAVMMVFAFSSAAMADPVSNGDIISVRDGVGDVSAGIFKVYKEGNYIFDTFCLERSETVKYYPNEYFISIDTYAVGGGLGAYEVAPGIIGDPISNETAYLYYKFRTGAYDKTDAFAMSALQVAFWILEGEYNVASGTFDTYEAAALGYINSADGKWDSIKNVRVMNLYSYDANQNIILNQSMLTMVPEPLSLLLLGFGLIGLGVAGRRFKK